MNTEIINSLYNFLPEITLAITIQLVLILSIVEIRNRKIYCAVTVSGISAALILTLLKSYEAPLLLFSGTMVRDNFSITASILILISSLIIVLLFLDPKTHTIEHILAILIPAGGMLAVSSVNLLFTFASLEAISIALYIFISHERKLALKYYMYGITSSAMMLYGISMIYGLSGSLDYFSISRFLSLNQFNTLTLSIAIILITAGFGFKLLIAPFNFLFPSLSEKVSLRTLGLISIPVIIAALFSTQRYFLMSFHDLNSYVAEVNVYKLLPGINWQLFLAIVSACSIIAGNITVLWIDNLKKFFSFLLIGQSGLLLAGLASSSPQGTEAMIFNSVVFSVNSAGIIFCLKFIENKFSVFSVSSLIAKGMGKKSPAIFIPLLLFMTSIAGIPPLAGFTGKLILYSSIASSGFGWLVWISVLSSLVMMYRIYVIGYGIFSGENAGNTYKIETYYKTLLLILVLPVILFGVYPQLLLDWAKFASKIIGI